MNPLFRIPVTKNGIIAFGALALIIVGVTATIFIDGLLERVRVLESKTVSFDQLDFTSQTSKETFIRSVYEANVFISQAAQQQAVATSTQNAPQP